ncbi:MAG: glucose-6-phosphate dehydrogenase [Buchnera aphidicola (Periphyllus lyropictus)]|uniref:glucose-6-phosphate dehydrogenase n=1 Tax=Buchnera aphidicola TaxID=9 RepID=UPI001EC0A62B|nr:glucose-6-phosphate dehydrogenase [Buchnera aphidicola]NIH16816.1 glucose-6-phosphate dehydrogenase [Buchnera aphidicola (Periphyllus lyropictus)]USS94827.1 glucose-6-phosphate dehydrogenase [Buchnera aphidicola (Periphyllus lyropictus)]
MVISKKIKAYDLVIFGTKGDLARKKLLPSLYRLEKLNKLYKDTRIIGIGRANWKNKEYKKIAKQSIYNYNNKILEKNIWKKFSSRLHFLNIDVNDINNFHKLKKLCNKKKRIIIHYFAMPPSIFGIICKGLGKFNLNSNKNRIIIEKPIGTSLKTSKKINNTIGKYFLEKQIFRIDHYLGKETILNLIALKFSNSHFFTNWNKNTVDHIQITVSEEVGIEGRWSYFDKVGQMKDMIQNHLLQILSIIAMSPPDNLKANNIQLEKLKVLKSLSIINRDNINEFTVRGQYTSGLLKNLKVPGYINEIGSIKNRNTETFVAIKVNIKNSQWNNVPFYLRTGKRMPIKKSEIVIFFKPNYLNLFKKNNENKLLNKMVINLQPNEGIDIYINNKVPGLDSNFKLKQIKFKFSYQKEFKNLYLYDAYERLLLESSLGNQSLFVSKKEIEASWKWVDSIIKSWKKKKSKVEFYKAGTWGPESSNYLLKKDGRSWNKI